MGTRGLVIVALSLCALAACGEDPYPYVGTGDDAPDAEPGPDSAPVPDAGDLGLDGSTDDGLGPTIVAVTPAAGALVAGIIDFTYEITDADGVENSSVIATIAGTHTIELTKTPDGHWTGAFDTRVLAGLVFPTIVVRAEDLAGNQGELGYLVALDNQAPFASLDPPKVREARIVDGELICSRPFDPLGDDAANDGERIQQLTSIRARVQDVGNNGTMTSNVFIPNAGVADVSIYVLDDTTRPLVVDTDGNGSCDDINPEIVPSAVPSAANEAAVVHLTAFPSGGTSHFATTTFGVANAGCVQGDDDPSDPPSALCLFTEATRIPEVPILHAPMVYAIPPSGTLACEGFAFDAVASNITDGWACVAVRAVDALGNIRVSDVMRVCVDSDNNLSAPCTTDTPAGAPPCTGTYNATTDVVTSVACTPAEFLEYATPNDYELLRTDL